MHSGHLVDIAFVARPDPLRQPEVQEGTDAPTGPRRYSKAAKNGRQSESKWPFNRSEYLLLSGTFKYNFLSLRHYLSKTKKGFILISP